jgi:hypothetical protein
MEASQNQKGTNINSPHNALTRDCREKVTRHRVLLEILREHSNRLSQCPCKLGIFRPQLELDL